MPCGVTVTLKNSSESRLEFGSSIKLFYYLAEQFKVFGCAYRRLSLSFIDFNSCLSGLLVLCYVLFCNLIKMFQMKKMWVNFIYCVFGFCLGN